MCCFQAQFTRHTQTARHGTYLYASHTKLIHTPLQLIHSQLWCVHRKRSESHKPTWVGCHRLCDVVVDDLGQVVAMLWLCPVGKHNRHRGKNLCVCVCVCARACVCVCGERVRVAPADVSEVTART